MFNLKYPHVAYDQDLQDIYYAYNPVDRHYAKYGNMMLNGDKWIATTIINDILYDIQEAKDINQPLHNPAILLIETFKNSPYDELINLTKDTLSSERVFSLCSSSLYQVFTNIYKEQQDNTDFMRYWGEYSNLENFFSTKPDPTKTTLYEQIGLSKPLYQASMDLFNCFEANRYMPLGLNDYSYHNPTNYNFIWGVDYETIFKHIMDATNNCTEPEKLEIISRIISHANNWQKNDHDITFGSYRNGLCDLLDTIKGMGADTILTILEYVNTCFDNSDIHKDILTYYPKYLKRRSYLEKQGVSVKNYQVTVKPTSADIQRHYEAIEVYYRKVCEENINRNFDKLCKENDNLYHEEDDTFILRAPVNLEEVITEDYALQNSVDVFVSDVAFKNAMIFFIRRKANMHKSYCDLIVFNDKLGYVLGDRWLPVCDQDVLDFIENWCNKHNIDTNDTNYE